MPDERTMRRLPRQGAVLGLALAAALGLAACDLLRDPSPDSVSLRLEGAPGTEALLVTSTQFLAQQQRRIRDNGLPYDTLLIQVFAAETTRVALPFEQAYDISGPRRFLARVFRLDRATGALRVRADIDGETRFERATSAVPADSVVQFLYVFNGGFGGNDDDVF